MNQVRCIGVIGGNEASAEVLGAAREVGKLIAARGAMLVCGGLGGVMEAASRGAAEEGGTVVGLLPSEDRSSVNPYVTVAVPTGMGIGRTRTAVHRAGSGKVCATRTETRASGTPQIRRHAP